MAPCCSWITFVNGSHNSSFVVQQVLILKSQREFVSVDILFLLPFSKRYPSRPTMSQSVFGYNSQEGTAHTHTNNSQQVPLPESFLFVDGACTPTTDMHVCGTE